MVQPRARRILLLARGRSDLDDLPARLADSPRPIVARATRRMGEALFALAHERFDAAVCWIQLPSDVAKVVRLKKAAPGIPVVALTPNRNAELAELSLRMGAAAVLEGDSDPVRTAATLERAIELRELASRLTESARLSLSYGRTIQGRAARSHLLAAQILQSLTLNPAEGFEPLLVEDDPDEALIFARALRKLGLSRRVPIVRSADEAIEYLSGRGEFADRGRYPAPSLVVLDFHLGPETGEKVLRWIRGNPRHARLPVVLLSACRDEAGLARMTALGLNAHVEKPQATEEMEATVKLILDFWQMWRTQGGEPG